MELNKVIFRIVFTDTSCTLAHACRGEKQYKVQTQMCNLSLVIRLSVRGIRVIWGCQKDEWRSGPSVYTITLSPILKHELW